MASPHPERLQTRAKCPAHSFEVINFGIPHLTSDQIVALFEEEGAKLRPDFVTFYAGNNDSFIEPDADDFSLTARIFLYLRETLLFFKYAEFLFQRITPKDAYFGDQYSRIRASFFVENLTKLQSSVLSGGGKLLVATQQKRAKSTLGWLPDEESLRVKLAGVTYDDEISLIRAKLDSGESLSRSEVSLLYHQSIMNATRKWAEEKKVPLVDIINALDEHRNYLLTWVHLHPDGNKIVAANFAREIMDRTCH